VKRREFITLLGGTAGTWPLAALAQQPAGWVYRMGCLTIATREQQLHLFKALEEGLRSLGYRVGENVVIEYRFADGELDRPPALASDLVRLGVEVIVTGSAPNTIAAMKATKTIPIVMTSSSDPIGTERSCKWDPARPSSRVEAVNAPSLRQPCRCSSSRRGTSCVRWECSDPQWPWLLPRTTAVATVVATKLAPDLS